MKAIAGRYSADTGSDVVVFLIGMRINKPWLPWKWWPTMRSMTPMLKSLHADPSKGLLFAQRALLPGVGPTIIQYWRSIDDLDRFARDATEKHHPMQRWFNAKVGYDGDVGIWHETYLVRGGDYEAIYGNMPRVGLAVAMGHRDIGKDNLWMHFAQTHTHESASTKIDE